jgi:two-component system OmpR family response regulator
MKILLVEDDEKVALFIKKGLKQDGHNVTHAGNGEDGLHFADTESYDVAIVDIMLPKLDGLTLVERLRRKKNATPVIILSSKSGIDDRVRGLQAGSDDYLTKPFAFTELLARIYAITRRSASTPKSFIQQFDDLTLDIQKRKVSRDGKEILLQPLEFSLLEYLMRNAGKVVSKTMIMEQVWDYNFDPQTNVIETRISRLRDKIDQPYKIKFIHTVRGFGYVFEERQ